MMIGNAFAELNRTRRATSAALLGGSYLLLSVQTGSAQTLGAAQSYAIVAGTTATAAGTGSVVDGDVGVSPGTSATGFDGTAATITPPFALHVNDGQAILAQTATTTLYGELDVMMGCTALGAELSTQDLGPGLYCFTSTANIAATGSLILRGAGTYIFQVGSSITANVDSTITLLDGAQACDVFWQVTNAATLNGDLFVGTVVAQDAITIGSGAMLTGRALATAMGAVTLAGSNTVGGCSLGEAATETPTETATETPTQTPTETPTQTATETATETPTNTATASPSPTVSATATESATATQTPTATTTSTTTSSPTVTPTGLPSITATGTPTGTTTATATGTPTGTASASVTPSATITPTIAAATATASVLAATATPSRTRTITRTPSLTPTSAPIPLIQSPLEPAGLTMIGLLGLAAGWAWRRRAAAAVVRDRLR